jgi:hypothetical protein
VTPLQIFVRALGDLVADARDELSPEAYSWFIAIACELVGAEAGRLFAGEVLRATRKDEAA